MNQTKLFSFTSANRQYNINRQKKLLSHKQRSHKWNKNIKKFPSRMNLDQYPRGVLAVYMTRGSDVFGGGVEILHPRYFGEVKRYRSWLNKSVLRYSSLVYFRVGNFWSQVFFGCKISGLCIFEVCSMNLPWTPLPRHVYCEVPPADQYCRKTLFKKQTIYFCHGKL